MAQQRTALITGANRGLGEKVAEILAAQGMQVIVGSRDLAAGEVVAERLQAAGHQARALALDVSKPESVAAAGRQLDQWGVAVDVLVNNAGIYPEGDLLDNDMATVREAMEVHFFGPLEVSKIVLPGMQQRGYGRIVNVSSGLGQISDGLDGGAGAYAVSKAAMNALTNRLASEVQGDLAINAVCPGWVRTRMGGAGAPRSLEEGAAGIVWAATLPAGGPTGGFFRDGKPIPW